ncbi:MULTISPECIES: BLUF domain-containing protein [unclassified Novosphingobium]|uniref:BLUF domain-containing protein n=1 Tax=unclassified Novosphingobium TaxID=2644732 RepID=UPI000A79EC84|nr:MULTISPECIES: BLUF domain-containing protein [unclassified Novosphingobium]MBN9143994.1 BLUF domain-containing protein [Novosphingobium sp.]MDR6709190.1 23S rRNA U2552 (ribose-2'-O)-methylase RlmE/FtsJ [Novosphingobium sp. 1748]
MTQLPLQGTGLAGWLYASRCALPSAWAQRAVDDIVAKSVPRNAALDVTGALLFTGARFVQFLEGPAESIVAIRQNILADRRHHDIVTFLSGGRAERVFSNWSLAYAGPSLFVADKVENLFHTGIRHTAEIIDLLEQFVIISEANKP